jgi:hypothetical protein
MDILNSCRSPGFAAARSCPIRTHSQRLVVSFLGRYENRESKRSLPRKRIPAHAHTQGRFLLSHELARSESVQSRLPTFAGELDFGRVGATSATDLPMLWRTGVARKTWMLPASGPVITACLIPPEGELVELIESRKTARPFKTKGVAITSALIFHRNRRADPRIA